MFYNTCSSKKKCKILLVIHPVKCMYIFLEFFFLITSSYTNVHFLHRYFMETKSNIYSLGYFYNST